MAEGELLAIADELYAASMADFTPLRDACAKELKAEKSPLAAEVKALKKPSLAAWVVNLLVRREADQVAQVLQVGVALREAQATLSGEDLRALTRQRRQLTAAVTQRARATALEEGVRVTQSVADQVEATLTAAMLDAGAADAVRSGLLVTALSATGVDAVDVAAAVALPDALGFAATAREAEPPPRPGLHVVPDTDEVRDARARREAEEALESAESALREATTAAEDAQEAYSTLEARSLQIQAEMDELRSKLAELEEASEETDEELAEAEETLGEARDAQADATKERDKAAEVLDKLG
ncbi:hypothetical protein [Nocardioides bigeumensis]|uniref:Transposase n=1 Tax=Nocardioides bigeumensis TaxID=433657 RepID=A0ABP5JLT1_9ACTN